MLRCHLLILRISTLFSVVQQFYVINHSLIFILEDGLMFYRRGKVLPIVCEKTVLDFSMLIVFGVFPKEGVHESLQTEILGFVDNISPKDI